MASDPSPRSAGTARRGADERYEAVEAVEPHGPVVDAHTHVACGDDPRFPTRPTGVASDWWRHGGTADELLGALDAAGVVRAVVVQAVGAYGHDCACAADVVAAHPGRLALVASVDMDDDDPAADAAGLCARLAATTGRPPAGIRLFGVGRTEPGWLTDGRADAVWQVARDLGTTLVPTLFARHLADLAAVIERCPEVPVALDHCAFPDMGDEGEAPLLALADLPEVHLKVTSYVLEAAERDEGDPRHALGRLVAAFGAERLCWGSDHPQDQRLSYDEKLALGHHAARALEPADRDALFAGTALRLWFS